MSRNAPKADELVKKVCTPCEGGSDPLPDDEIQEYLLIVPGWRITEDGLRIQRDWVLNNFLAAIEFFRKVAELAESEGHHPDLHLTGYRNVTIQIYTHAVGGLTENDFILAVKINEIPVEEKS